MWPGVSKESPGSRRAALSTGSLQESLGRTQRPENKRKIMFKKELHLNEYTHISPADMTGRRHKVLRVTT